MKMLKPIKLLKDMTFNITAFKEMNQKNKINILDKIKKS